MISFPLKICYKKKKKKRYAVTPWLRNLVSQEIFWGGQKNVIGTAAPLRSQPVARVKITLYTGINIRVQHLQKKYEACSPQQWLSRKLYIVTSMSHPPKALVSFKKNPHLTSPRAKISQGPPTRSVNEK